MSLDASNHKEHKYILLYIVKGWGYESVFFLDIRSLMKWGGEGGHAPVGIPSQCHWICLIIRNTNIYGLGVGISF